MSNVIIALGLQNKVTQKKISNPKINRDKICKLYANPRQRHKDFIVSRCFHTSLDAESRYAKLFPSAITKHQNKWLDGDKLISVLINLHLTKKRSAWITVTCTWSTFALNGK